MNKKRKSGNKASNKTNIDQNNRSKNSSIIKSNMESNMTKNLSKETEMKTESQGAKMESLEKSEKLEMPIDIDDTIQTVVGDDAIINTNALNKANQKKMDNKNEGKKTEPKTSSEADFDWGLGLATLWSVALIGAFIGFNFYVVPNVILEQTDDKKAVRSSSEAKVKADLAKKENDKKLAGENQKLNFGVNKDWTTSMEFAEFGTINIVMNNEWAPKTVENFVRLAYRGYFDGTKIHRIVEEQGFGVIQGGDAEKADGTGGKSAFYLDETNTGLVPDELWKVKPEFSQDPQNPVLINKPEFRNPSFYTNFDTDQGTVVYPKGLILMAKTAEPDSASSQFFITLSDTTLPAQYTAFGKIEDKDIAILDKISQEVEPIIAPPAEGQPPVRDGKPNKDLVIGKVKIVSPVV